MVLERSRSAELPNDAAVKPARGRASSLTSGLSLRARRTLFAYTLLAPAVIFVVALIAYPLIMAARLAFLEGRFTSLLEAGKHKVGLGQFTRLWDDPSTWSSLRQSVVYVIGSLAPSFVLGLGLALLLWHPFRGRRWIRTLILLPWAVPGVLASAVFLWMLDQSFGIANSLLVKAHLIHSPVPWYSSTHTAMIGVILPTVWKLYPFFTIVLLAALQTVPEELMEAAWVDGAGPIRRFTTVTWPAIRGPAYVVIIISALGTYREFDFIFPLTRGGPSDATSTLAIRIYNEAFQYSDMGYAAATGVFATLIATVFVILTARRIRSL